MQLDGEGTEQAIEFSPDGNTLAVATAAGGNRANLYLIDPSSGRKRLAASWHSIPSNLGPRRFTRFAFSPDGRRLAVAVSTGAPDVPFPTAAHLYLLDMPSGRPVWRRDYPLRPGQNEVSVAFTRDGTLVTSAPQGETLLWDAGRGRIERSFPIGGQFAVSPDGRLAAIAQNSPSPAEPTTSLALLDLRSGSTQELPPPPSPTWIIAAAFTPDGRRIVTASFDLALRVWDVESGSILQTFTDQPSGQNLALLPDGRTVVSGADTGSVAAWDLSGDQQLSRAFSWNTPDMSCLGHALLRNQPAEHGHGHQPGRRDGRAGRPSRP